MTREVDVSRLRTIHQPGSKQLDEDPQWYRDAVIYQLHVRAFCDSNGDGIGDFRGLTEKLPYLQSLGVTAVWLLPFFPSPLKDDGYDIADYKNINPAYGTLAEFQEFVDEAHERGLRVITELVMNHTSDQHEWFQRSRRSEPGSKWREYYVWSDTTQRYRDARVIFHDFETANWTWDPVAKSYFWHRFYHHQPDLNFENPDVHEAMLGAIDFWLEKGVDGLRLDAVPYLYERDGTNCENLPETHAFLKTVRQHVDSRFQDKMLLAEANQWPEDAAAYFGDGDECHMNFHFPLMPRLYIAVEREDHLPILDILEQTPSLPSGCQWGIFLRNHDELTLEMVTDEERDYMYRAYANDPQTRLNQGIRRRLAPLLQNNRRKIELLNGLLFSLPGTPIVYYGDEIGMGDNIYLGDRDGVRTPMQWSPDRNAGFSRSSPQRLYLPVIIESAYHYNTVNVEVENESPHSLLWWMRRLMRIRGQFQAFGRGDFRLLRPENAKVLAYLRQYQGETLLVVANLSRFPQCVELDLSEFRGQVPVELSGHVKFPPIGELPYLLTLGSHAFYWFQLQWESDEKIELSPDSLPACEVKSIWPEMLSGQRTSLLESALHPFLKRDRWFNLRMRKIQSVELTDAIPVDAPADKAVYWLLLVRVESFDQEEDIDYQIPVAIAERETARNLIADHPTAGILEVKETESGSQWTICDASWERGFWLAILKALGGNQSIRGQRGDSFAVHTPEFDEAECKDRIRDPLDAVSFQPDVGRTGGDMGSVTAVSSEGYQVKLFRHLCGGVSPAFELGCYLNKQQVGEFVPRVYAAMQYRRDHAEPQTLAMLSEHRKAEGDGWSYAMDELGRSFERYSTSHTEPLPEPGEILVHLFCSCHFPGAEACRDLFGTFLRSMDQLGRRAAELHTALAAASEEPELVAQPLNELYQRSLYQTTRSWIRRSAVSLSQHLDRLPNSTRGPAQQVIASQELLLDGVHQDLSGKLDGQRIRCHGSFGLQHVLFTGDDFVITDFGGAAARPASEMRIKASPLRDIASMIGSLLAAGHAGLRGEAPGILVVPELQPDAKRFGGLWFAYSTLAFLDSYRSCIKHSEIIPADDDDLARLLRVHLIEHLCIKLWDALAGDDLDPVTVYVDGLMMLIDCWDELQKHESSNQ
jgi:maltose alpha-D-glucosyltransferase/alpha-amylase